MTKFMVFIDGSWLYANTIKLASEYGRPDLQIDYGLLPEAVCERASAQLNVDDIDIVRTYMFASVPDNYDPADIEIVRRRLDFFNILKEEYHYEVDIFPIDFRGRRVRAHDRDPDDKFEPREKCVDIALASSMLYFAAIPNAYDVALGIIGDQDYVPVLQHIRRLAKRVAIASIRGSCASEYVDPADTRRVKDVDIIWLNDMIPEIELKYEPRQLVCQSEFHQGDRRVWTTFRPRKGQPFYCDDCRREHAERIETKHRPFIDSFKPSRGPYPEAPTQTDRVTGTIYEIKANRRFGFIRSETGREYFFHLTDLSNMNWEHVGPGLTVSFLIISEPSYGKAGKATDVRALDFDEQEDPELDIEF